MEQTLGEKLTGMIESMPAERITPLEILDRLGQEGVLIFVVSLTLPFMAPVSIPGVSTFFGSLILLIGYGVMQNRKPWIAERIMKCSFPVDKIRVILQKGTVWLGRLERISRPRLSKLGQRGIMARLNGFMLVFGALLLMVPFGLVPLTNFLSGLAILFISVGILQRDGVCVLLGCIVNLVTAIYFTQLIKDGAFVMRAGMEMIFTRYLGL